MTASKKSAGKGSKKGAAKGGAKVSHIGAARAKKGGAKGDGDEGFTAGDVNDNIRPDPHDEPKGAGKRGRQERLPGVEEDPLIEALQDAALDYADIRDQRQALTAREVEAKGRLKDLMHAHKKEVYRHGGVVVTLVKEEENVKVKIKATDEEKTQVELL